MSDLSNCVHCGEPASTSSYKLNDLIFCCNGCKVVYHFLADNGLENYYKLQDTPGSTIKDDRESQDFSYLDDPELLESIHEFYSDTLAKITLSIPSIHCSSCVWLLEKLSSILAGVKSSRCNLFKAQLVVIYNPEAVQLSRVISQLYLLGYETELKIDNFNSEREKPDNLDLMIRLGVAAFCLANTMTLALPEYVGPGEVSPFLKKVFDFISFILSIPVVMFSAKPYFTSATKSLKHGYINWDVPITMGILSLFLTSIYALFMDTGQLYFDSLCGFLFFLLLGEWVKKRTFQKLNFDRSFNSFLPLGVTLKQEQNFTTIPLNQLKKGDQILIRSQDIIPCDGILLSEQASINYSFITGEFSSISIKKDDEIKAGGLVENSSVLIQSENSAKESYLIKLWQDLDESKVDESPQFMPFPFYFCIFVILLAITTFLIWLPTSFDKALLHMTSILIVACPCALALSKPYTHSNAQRILSNHGLYLKNTDSIEKFEEIQEIVFDKTGTLTQINLGIFQDKSIKKETLELIKSCAILSRHPICSRICQELSELSTVPHKQFQEVKGQGVHAKINEQLVRIGKKSFCFDNEEDDHLTYITIDSQQVQSFSYFDQPRAGSKELIDRLRQQFKVTLLTGDHKKPQHPIFSIFNHTDKLIFSMRPEDKLHYIQNQNRNCLMVGDGMNDTGALKAAKLGLSVCEDLQGFHPACNGMLLAKNITKLSLYFRYTITCKRIVFYSFILSILYNCFGLYFAMNGTLTPLICAILMPLSSISIMLFTWFMTEHYAKKIFNEDCL
ncbi:MAG: heavy metal translocating P-type ATPase metal-binding domain-containing protein [Candidatus Cloacimonetes bacterium]|nr:heavy metal translocating P-type ATPase metal-binding domain-containing protein [Candidatus Cloacimonadota bacterium]